MLDALRRGAKTWVAKILLLVLVASFGVWGIAGVTNIGWSSPLAEVGDTEIDTIAFQRTYTRQLQAMTRQMGQPIDRDFAMALGIPQQVLSQMMSDATLTATARDMGLGVSEQGIGREIVEDPSLRPPGSDTFDRIYFTRLLRENGLTEQAYLDDRRLNSVRSQLTDGLVGGLTPPEAYVSLFNRYRSETRSIDYAVLPTAAAGPVPEPTDSELDTWYQAHKDDYQAPEYRKLAILAVTPDKLADPSTVDDEAARKEYDRTLSNYTTPEQRRVRQVLFPTVEEARTASERIKAGESLDTVIAERGLAPEDVDLGLITRDRILDKAIADVAFSLEPNVVSDPVEARFGGALVEVTEVSPGAVQPFDQVRDEIKTQIATREADRLVLETHDEIEDARAGGATLAEIADRFNLDLVTVDTDDRGLDPSGALIPAIPNAEAVLRAGFAAEQGDESDPVRADNGFVWFSVENVTPEQDRPLQDVRDRVVTAWKAEKTADLLADKAKEIADAVRAGGDFAQLAAAADAEVKTETDLTRASQPQAFGPAGLEAVFAGPTGHVAAVPGNGETQVVLKVTDVTVPPFFPEAADSQQIAGQLRGQLANSLIALFIDDKQAELGTSINQQLLQQAIGSTSR